MLTSFIEELQKIAANMLSAGAVAEKPAAIAVGSRLMGRMPSSTKPVANYSVLNTSPQVAANEASTSIKSVPPPPVRT